MGVSRGPAVAVSPVSCRGFTRRGLKPAYRAPGTGIFLNRGKSTAPLALRANVEHNHVLHDHVVILEIKTLPVPHVASGTWHRFKFAAVVTLDAAGRSRGQYLSGVPGLMVRAPSCQLPARRQYFPAVVYTDDDRPLRPGDKGVHVAMSVPDDDAASFFQSGQHFTLWDGADIGHGTVARRLFFQEL